MALLDKMKLGELLATKTESPEEERARIDRERNADPTRCDLLPLAITVLGEPHADAVEWDGGWEGATDEDRANFGEEHQVWRHDYDSDDEYDEALEKARRRWTNVRNSASFRLYPAGSEFTPHGRRRISCPVCEPSDDGYGYGFADDGKLVLEFRPFDVAARCLSGCEPAAIAQKLSRMIADREREQAAQNLAADISRVSNELALVPEPAPPHPWLIPGIVPERALTLWIAPTESMKTWLLIHAAICVAAGIPFLGRPVIRKRVMLALLEATEINEARIEPLARGLGVTRDALKDWLYVRRAEFKSDVPASTAILANQIDKLGIELLAIDNYKLIRSSRALFAANSEDIAAAAIAPLETLAHAGTLHEANAGRRCAVVLLVHGDDGRPRGSSAPPEHADWVMSIERARKLDPESPIAMARAYGCRLTHPDAKCSVRYRGEIPAAVTPELGDERPKAAAPATATTDGNLSARRTTIIEIVKAAPGAGLNAVCEGLVARNAGASKRDVIADLAWLVDDGWLRRDDTKKYFISDDE